MAVVHGPPPLLSFPGCRRSRARFCPPARQPDCALRHLV